MALSRQQRRFEARNMRRQRQPPQKPNATGWMPLVEVPASSITLHCDFEAAAKQNGITIQELRELSAQLLSDAVWFTNDVYEVAVKPAERAGWTHLLIRRRDLKPIVGWVDKQRIKNQLVGPGCEGLELFPSESRAINDENVYHLWVNSTPHDHLDVGFKPLFDRDGYADYLTNTQIADG
jgi:hypothetical protein